MNRFTKALKKLGVKVIHPRTTIIRKKGFDQDDFEDLIYSLRKSRWAGINKIKGRKIRFISTNDLNENNKLYPNFLERRKRRKQKKSGAFKWSKSDWR